MTLIELLTFLWTLLLTLMLGRFLTRWIGMWGYAPAILAGSLLTLAAAVMLFAEFRELWQAAKRHQTASRDHRPEL